MSDTSLRMRVEACPTCALPFYLPLDFYLLKLKNAGSIHCPSGHLIRLSIDKPGMKTDAIQMCIELQSELKQARHDLERARAYIARLPQPPEGPIDEKEFKRRVELLTHRAERVEYGKTLCRFCGKQQQGTGRQRSHLRLSHHLEIRSLPASFFD